MSYREQVVLVVLEQTVSPALVAAAVQVVTTTAAATAVRVEMAETAEINY